MDRFLQGFSGLTPEPKYKFASGVVSAVNGWTYFTNLDFHCNSFPTFPLLHLKYTTFWGVCWLFGYIFVGLSSMPWLYWTMLFKRDIAQFFGLHPQKLTWNLEMMVSNRNLLFQGSIFRFHVCFGGCIIKLLPFLAFQLMVWKPRRDARAVSEKPSAWNHSSSLKKKAPNRRSSPKFQKHEFLQYVIILRAYQQTFGAYPTCHKWRFPS